eukprot:118841-Amphidinium_carterae.1
MSQGRVLLESRTFSGHYNPSEPTKHKLKRLTAPAHTGRAFTAPSLCRAMGAHVSSLLLRTDLAALLRLKAIARGQCQLIALSSGSTLNNSWTRDATDLPQNPPNQLEQARQLFSEEFWNVSSIARRCMGRCGAALQLTTCDECSYALARNRFKPKGNLV